MQDHSHHTPHENASTSVKEYVKYLTVILFILILTFINSVGKQNTIQDFIQGFMGYFFITFSFFKFLDLKEFAHSFSLYDIIASKIHLYGFIYPFIELSFGILFLTMNESTNLNVATIIVMTVSGIGVIKTMLDKKTIKCACLGNVVNLPVTTITLIESLGMGIMAAVMMFI